MSKEETRNLWVVEWSDDIGGWPITKSYYATREKNFPLARIRKQIAREWERSQNRVIFTRIECLGTVRL